MTGHPARSGNKVMSDWITKGNSSLFKLIRLPMEFIMSRRFCGNFITLGLGPVRSFPSITWFRRLTSTGTVSPGRTPTMAARMEYIPSTGFPFSFISTSPAVNPLRCAPLPASTPPIMTPSPSQRGSETMPR